MTVEQLEKLLAKYPGETEVRLSVSYYRDVVWVCADIERVSFSEGAVRLESAPDGEP